MERFEVHTTGERFSQGTEQYCLFRRARDLRSFSYRATMTVEAVLAVVAVIMAVVERDILGMMLFFAAAAAILIWHLTGEVQGRDTKNYIKKARAQVISPEDAAKEIVITFDGEGCTLSAPGTTLPGRNVEEQTLFGYGSVDSIFESEDYFLVVCKKAGSVCFAKADLTVGTPDELRTMLEEKSGHKTIHYALKSEALQKLAR